MISTGRKGAIAIVALVSLAVTLLIIAGLRSIQNSDAAATPPYYREIPERLPAVLDSKLFSDETRESYKAAAMNARLFAQLPCYCHCERTNGHKSLLSCFADAHGTECSICRREALFAAAEVRRGKQAAEIRDEIIRGLWSRSEVGMARGRYTLDHH
jgi:hypothetical protein